VGAEKAPVGWPSEGVISWVLGFGKDNRNETANQMHPIAILREVARPGAEYSMVAPNQGSTERCIDNSKQHGR
jgi:hypothetical protein